MVDLLLYTSLTCAQADAIMLRIKDNQDMNQFVRIEMVEVVKESKPECKWESWDAND